MPPKRQRTETATATAAGFPSLAFLVCARIVDLHARDVARHNEPARWPLPPNETLRSDDYAHLRDAYLREVNMNPNFGWCTICHRYSFMAKTGVHAGPCYRCRLTPEGIAEPPICAFTATVLLRWGYTCDEQGSWAWHNARAKMLTASDAYVALGIKGFKSAPKLAREKAGLEPKQVSTYAMTHGNLKEDEARQKYAERTGRKVFQLGLIPLEAHPWLGASPDGLTNDGILVEIKCPVSRVIGRGVVPAMYMPQLQLQLQSIQAEELDFVQYKPAVEDYHYTAEEEFVITRVKRSDDWLAQSLPKMRRFFDSVQCAMAIRDSAGRVLAAMADVAISDGDGRRRKRKLAEAISAWANIRGGGGKKDDAMADALKWTVRKRRRAAPAKRRFTDADDAAFYGTVQEGDNCCNAYAFND
ncbi:YqaJ viral recombinase [Acanthamoeba castellanii medusavirus]|uniref:YqaJ viral recombinase n=1 Tax=Acanthamoeba castellanii medusavirus J1 TaxID=3114988 RepID=A0A3T1CWL1_9VIRU|nr:YqaJ viral recombinase [Acanthamoeba castellanii medusavirus]BBI30211.1 YqaJ viral recombinase [Acanthamoeba castellanii medusavirus J1]